VFEDARFRRFLAARVVSEAGSGVGAVALPLTAVLTLSATPMDMGLLGAAYGVPVLLLSLHIGVWVDRLPRKPIVVATDLGRGVLLMLVPLAALAGWLRIEVLWAIAFAVGALGVTFDIAVTTFVPSLVERGRLVQANGTLQASGAAARVVGPSVGGWLVQTIGAPFALVADAISFVTSAAILAPLRVAEGAHAAERRAVWAEIGEGITTVWREPNLRAMVLSATFGALAGSIQQAVYVLFVVQDVEVPPTVLGGILACGSAAGLLGAAAAGRTARLLTPGGAMLAGEVAITLSTFLVLAARPGALGVLLLAVAQVLFTGGLATYSVTQISLRQAMTPSRILGRVNATRRVSVFGIQPFGALLGGALGTLFGLHVALLVAAFVNIVALAVLVSSPLARAKEGAVG